jgi:hypothetical protein
MQHSARRAACSSSEVAVVAVAATGSHRSQCQHVNKTLFVLLTSSSEHHSLRFRRPAASAASGQKHGGQRPARPAVRSMAGRVLVLADCACLALRDSNNPIDHTFSNKRQSVTGTIKCTAFRHNALSAQCTGESRKTDESPGHEKVNVWSNP